LVGKLKCKPNIRYKILERVQRNMFHIRIIATGIIIEKAVEENLENATE
jgi:hypothetical protein